jgi:hypothetical protein
LALERSCAVKILAVSAAFLGAYLTFPSAHAQTCDTSFGSCLSWNSLGWDGKAIRGDANGGGTSYGVEGNSFVNNAASAGVHGFSGYGNAIEGLAADTGLNGVQGTAWSYGASGVYGENMSGWGYGVAGRVAGNGTAVFGDHWAGGWAGYFNGKVFASISYTSSDARLKKDVKDLQYGMADVLKLRPVTFKWKERSDGTTQIGLIAQEVQNVVPEVVTTAGRDGSDTLAVNYPGLVPVMIKALQDQQEVIERQEARIAALENARAPIASVFSGGFGRALMFGLVPLGLVTALRGHRRRKESARTS